MNDQTRELGQFRLDFQKVGFWVMDGTSVKQR
jgi:hypothetical protein